MYDDGHMPGATALHWKDELQQQVVRDVIDQAEFERLLGSKGIANDTTVVLYGDKNNWFAAYAYWYLKLYGHEDVRIMDGGRQKWIDEDRPLTTDAPGRAPKPYTRRTAGSLDPRLARRHPGDPRLAERRAGRRALTQEYSGELIAMPGYQQEGAQRGGHVPGAASIPWAQAVREDGTFKSAEELHALYSGKGVDGGKPITAYCRIGERSSHTLVRPARAARPPARPQLRRLVDRVGQHGGRADREGRLRPGHARQLYPAPSPRSTHPVRP